MKKPVLFLTCILYLFTLSCGGGGPSTGGGSNSSTPQLLAFDFSPTSAPANQNITVLFTFSFTDAGGDLDGGSLNYRASMPTETATVSTPISSSYKGVTQASITIPITTNSGPAGIYTYQIWLVDNKGNSSNILTRTLTST